jgi:hypothetical protein
VNAIAPRTMNLLVMTTIVAFVVGCPMQGNLNNGGDDVGGNGSGTIDDMMDDSGTDNANGADDGSATDAPNGMGDDVMSDGTGGGADDGDTGDIIDVGDNGGADGMTDGDAGDMTDGGDNSGGDSGGDTGGGDGGGSNGSTGGDGTDPGDGGGDGDTGGDTTTASCSLNFTTLADSPGDGTGDTVVARIAVVADEDAVVEINPVVPIFGSSFLEIRSTTDATVTFACADQIFLGEVVFVDEFGDRSSPGEVTLDRGVDFACGVGISLSLSFPCELSVQ